MQVCVCVCVYARVGVYEYIGVCVRVYVRACMNIHKGNVTHEQAGNEKQILKKY